MAQSAEWQPAPAADGSISVTVRLQPGPPSLADPASRRAAHTPEMRPTPGQAGLLNPQHHSATSIALVDALRFRRDAVRQVLQQCVPGSAVVCYDDSAALRAAMSQEPSRFGLIVIDTGGKPLWERAMRDEVRGLCHDVAGVPVVVLSDREGDDDVAEACRLGVRGFLPTRLEPSVAREVLRYVHAGGSYVPSGSLTRVLMAVLDGAAGGEHAGAAGPAAADGLALTPRQNQVLALLCQGKPNKVIAYELGMEEGTVKVHVRHIMRKLGARNRTEVLLRAQHFTLLAEATAAPT